jgi:hypothetical protein
MERIVITIHPPDADGRLLTVADAMQQVLDAVRLFTRAQAALANPEDAFDWLLEKATTNSPPFSVTALAVPVQQGRDVSKYVQEIEHAVSTGITKLVNDGDPPWWMAEILDSTRSLFQRNLNGIYRTQISLAANETINIDRQSAASGLRAIEAFDALNVGKEITPRTAWGEIQGVMTAVGRYRGKPAVAIRSEQYGFIWCPLPSALVDKFGGEHRLGEVWRGQVIGVTGKLIYSEGGRLSRIEAHDIREIASTAPVDLDALLDPDFTSGLDPVEYLRRLNEGELA